MTDDGYLLSGAPHGIEAEDAAIAEAGVDWWDEPCIRTSGEVVCKICDRPHWRHEQVAKVECPTLVRACDGRLLKL